MRKHLRQSAEQWQALVQKHQSSTLFAPQICEQHDVVFASLRHWRKRLRDTPNVTVEPLPCFLAVKPAAHQVHHPHWVTVHSTPVTPA